MFHIFLALPSIESQLSKLLLCHVSAKFSGGIKLKTHNWINNLIISHKSFNEQFLHNSELESVLILVTSLMKRLRTYSACVNKIWQIFNPIFVLGYRNFGYGGVQSNQLLRAASLANFLYNPSFMRGVIVNNDFGYFPFFNFYFIPLELNSRPLLHCLNLQQIATKGNASCSINLSVYRNLY